MRHGTGEGLAGWPLVGAAALVLALGGCSSVPDAVNPVKWYENTVDYFSGSKDKDRQTAAKPQPAPGADKPVPNLGSVPEKPRVSSEAERRQVAQGLVADRASRRYASEIPRQGAPTNVLGSGDSAKTTTSAAPAPVAVTPALPSLPAAPAPAPAARPAPQAAPTVAARAPMAAPQPTPQAPSALMAPPPPRVTLEPPTAATTRVPTTMAEVSPRFTQPVPPANAMMPGVGSAFETVVVSSSGVEAQQVGAPGLEPSREMMRPASKLASELTAPSGSVAARTVGLGESLRVATIQFANGSAQLDDRDRAILRGVLALQHERGGSIRIVGHASSRTGNMDPVRHKLVNFEISAARAQSVARELAQLGAANETIVVMAESDTDPVFYEFMPSGEAGNRRAEVFLDF